MDFPTLAGPQVSLRDTHATVCNPPVHPSAKKSPASPLCDRSRKVFLAANPPLSYVARSTADRAGASGLPFPLQDTAAVFVRLSCFPEDVLS